MLLTFWVWGGHVGHLHDWHQKPISKAAATAAFVPLLFAPISCSPCSLLRVFDGRLLNASSELER